MAIFYGGKELLHTICNEVSAIFVIKPSSQQFVKLNCFKRVHVRAIDSGIGLKEAFYESNVRLPEVP